VTGWAHGGHEKNFKIFSRNLKERDLFGEIIGERIILKLILEKQGVRIWTRSN
jgi:hypothetical protein